MQANDVSSGIIRSVSCKVEESLRPDKTGDQPTLTLNYGHGLNDPAACYYTAYLLRRLVTVANPHFSKSIHNPILP